MDNLIDIHTHILPGMDDGPKSWEESVEMCRLSADDGIEALVVTPHVQKGVYWNEEKEIFKKAKELRDRLKENRIPLSITAGADVHLDPETLPLIEKGTFSINPGRKYVLIEMEVNSIPQTMDEIVFNLLIKGINPILTHPERNLAIQQHPQKLYELVNKGLLVQITASSITGEFGIEAQKTSEVIIKHQLAHIIASDTHSASWRPPGLKKSIEAAASLTDEKFVMDMVSTYPKAVVAGEKIFPPEPLEIKDPPQKTFSFINKIFSKITKS